MEIHVIHVPGVLLEMLYVNNVVGEDIIPTFVDRPTVTDDRMVEIITTLPTIIIKTSMKTRIAIVTMLLRDVSLHQSTCMTIITHT